MYQSALYLNVRCDFPFQNSVIIVAVNLMYLRFKMGFSFDKLPKACLTQNTQLIQLTIRVNLTYNRTNRGLIRVTLGPFECIHESRV